MPNPLESPIPILIIGVLVVAALGVAFSQTGRALFLLIIVGVVALTGVGVLIESMAVTEVERIEQVLYGTMESLESNRPADASDGVLTFISTTEEADHTRREARRALKFATFESINLSKLEIQVIETTSPPTALVTFTLMAKGKIRIGGLGEFSRSPPMHFEIELRRESGEWKIIGHSWDNKPSGF